MVSIELIKSTALEQIIGEYKKINVEKRNASFNIFTISSKYAYRENFHSDVLAALLDPNGLHKNGYAFLDLFLSFLNLYYDSNVKPEDFKETIVTRETGRLDIWIRDEKSKLSIIIENKINNASDMEKQLDRYFLYAENGRKYKVCAVIYLSLDGTKMAPPTLENFDHLVKNVGAFTNQSNDLVNGWLNKCLELSVNKDSHSLIYQYITLLQHLAQKNMEIKIMENFYTAIGTEEAIKTVDAIIEMRNNIPRFRADKLAQSITSYKPFTRYYRYKSNYLLYGYYPVGNQNLKLDIWFESDGSAEVEFWNPSLTTAEGRQVLTERLSAIDMLDQFEQTFNFANNGYHKSFKLGLKYLTLSEVDAALDSFIKEFMRKLSDIPVNN